MECWKGGMMLPKFHYSIIPVFQSSKFLDTRPSFCLGILLGLAPDQRFGMTFQIVGQYAQRACRACNLLQSVTQILLGWSVLADERCVRALEHPVGGRNCAAQSVECRLQPRRDVYVDAIHRLARVFERLAKVRERLREIGADRFVRQLVELRDDAGDFRFEVRSSAREEVKGDKELPGEQVAATELRAQPPLLDQALHERVALLCAPNQGFAHGRLLCAQGGYQTLRI